MTEALDPLAGLRLEDHILRTYSFGEIAEEIGGEAASLRAWFNVGGLALMPPLDVVGSGGGPRGGHRLHWRTTIALLLAIKLNDYGFGLKDGEAAGAAGAVFTAGLGLEHLSSTDSPLISVQRDAVGDVRVALIRRDAETGAVEAPASLDGFEGIGTLLLDPIGLGRILWRLAIRQAGGEAPGEQEKPA